MRRLQCAALMVFMLTGILAGLAKAQNVFRVRFDTITAQAGDTVAVNVYYDFTSTHSHNLDYFQLRLQYDSSEIYPIGYELDGTASAGFFDTTVSHLGIAAQGQSELDLSNPVLIRIRFRINRQLADTAFIRWDTSFNLLDPSENIDQVLREDGWIRTASAAGHVVVSTPAATIHGVTVGYSPDSVAFDLPVSVSDIAAANMQSALLSFSYDSTVLSLGSVSSRTADSNVYISSSTSAAIPIGRQRVEIKLNARSGVISGGDTLLTLHFTGLVGLDTVCGALEDVSLRPLDSTASIGNTIYLGDSICLEGSAPSAVQPTQLEEAYLRVYPNPASAEVNIEAGGTNESPVVEVFDALGRRMFERTGASIRWDIPRFATPGAYQVIERDRTGQMKMKTMLLIER